MYDLGLALSGGGSRAAAFHAGTLRAIADLHLVERIDVVSTVSGGSLFGGAWLAARARGESEDAFLASMKTELERGFILRSLRPSLAKTFLPWLEYTRTHVIGDTFDRIFLKGLTLSGLPERPALCLNTSILNNGQVGKFSREGFSAWGLKVPGATPEHVVPWHNFPVAYAVAASAAFPVGLPPLRLGHGRFPSGTRFTEGLAGSKHLFLTDGGVLENLGIQTLLRSGRFAAWDLIVSDAGTADTRWSLVPGWSTVKGLGIWIASGRILDRLMIVMNNKQNRWARQEVIDQLESSWFAAALRDGLKTPAIDTLLRTHPVRARRKLIFARVNQTRKSFVTGIPRHRLAELADGNERDVPGSDDYGGLCDFLRAAGVHLEQADTYYGQLGDDTQALAMNEVKTNFTALPTQVVEQLSNHAAWQVHACAAVYGG